MLRKNIQLFEHYLKQLDTQSSTDLIPLEFRKQLLAYFEEKAQLKKEWNKDPHYHLGWYQHMIEMLKKSILEAEIMRLSMLNGEDLPPAVKH